MKKILLLLFILGSFSIKAQNNCANALPFCAGGTSGGTFPATTGTTSGETGPNYDCNGLQASPISYYVPSPSWYYIQIGQSGNLDILIEGQLGTPPNTAPGGDVDFVCWGPFNSLAGICGSLTANMTIDCSYSPSYTETLNIPNGIAGQYYMVMITNFYNQPQNIVLNQFGGTGTTNCSLVNNSSICAGTSKTITVANSTTLTNITYSIQPGGFVNSTGIFVVTPSVTTTYTTYLSGTTSQNFTITQTAIANVSVQPQPFTAPTTTQTTCTSTINALNLGLSFNPASPVPSYTVNWMPSPNGITSASQTTLVGGIIPGVYNYTITAAGGCSVSSLVTINAVPNTSFNILPVGPIYSITCTQPTVVLTGSDASYSYTWANGSNLPMTGQTTSYTAFSLGNWTVTGLNPLSNCFLVKTFTIVINNSDPVSSVSPLNQNLLCGPGTVATATGVAISPTINVQHTWYGPGGVPGVSSGGQISIFNPAIVGNNGTSTLVLTNLVNGCSTTKTIVVLSSSGFPTLGAITSNATSNTFTLGCSTRSVIDVNIVGANTFPTPGGSVTYTLLPPSYTGTNYVPGSSAAYTVNTPGTYIVVLKDNFNNCESRIPLSIVQNTYTPDISASAITRTLTCNTPSVLLNGASLTNNVTFNWKRNNSTTPTIFNSVITVTTTPSGTSVPSATVVDIYTLTIVDNSSTCLSTSLVTMYQNIRPPLPRITLDRPALTCAVYSINLGTDNKTGILPNTFFINAPVVAALWEGPTPQQPAIDVSTYLGYTPGTYTMTAKDRVNGCTAITTTVVGDNRDYPVLVTAPTQSLDCGAELTTGVKLGVSVIGLSAAAVTATWIVPSTANVSGPNSLTLTTTSVGRYVVSVTTNSNGCASQAFVTVVNGVLNGGFTADQTSGYAPLTVNFGNTSASSSTVTGTTSITTVWSFGNGTVRTTSTNIPTSAIYSQPGTYTVAMFARKGTCVDTVYKVITVDIPSKLEVPNVFTPNGDNSNDIFFVKSANLSEITAMIYDRWGNKIYELTTEKGNIAWDGKTQAGKEAPDGTYFYVITAKGKDGQNYDTKGTVSLYR